MSKNISQVLPKGDKEIIKDALIQYQRTLDCLIDKFEREGNDRMVDQLHHTRFDLHSLIGFTEYDMVINLPQKVKDEFVHKHNVDFPLYNEKHCKLEYPVKQESKWVTLITGDFSFDDDGFCGRKCYVNQLTTIEKHLREDVGEVIDCVENDGGGWIITEDYDGLIEMNFDKNIKKRLFQTVDVCGSYTVTNTFDEIINEGGYDNYYENAIDGLGVAETLEVHKEEVYVIRIK